MSVSAGSKLHSHEGEAPAADSAAARQFASPEQLQHGTVDFRSAIYSLGATMYFLLTGAAPPAKVRLRELRRFPKALRNLLAHMLRSNPDERPQDLAALEKEILKCLTKVEKRHAFGRRLGIPLAAVTPKEPKPPPTPLVQVLRGTLVVAALLLAIGSGRRILLPDDLNPFRHRTAAKQMIGVPIGVPNTLPSPSAQATNAAPIAGNQAMRERAHRRAKIRPQHPAGPNIEFAVGRSRNPPNAPTPMLPRKLDWHQTGRGLGNLFLTSGTRNCHEVESVCPTHRRLRQRKRQMPRRLLAIRQSRTRHRRAKIRPPTSCRTKHRIRSRSEPQLLPMPLTQIPMLPRKLTLQVKNRQLRPRKRTLRHSRRVASDSTSPTQREKAAGLASNRTRTGQSLLTSGTRNCHQAGDDRRARGGWHHV